NPVVLTWDPDDPTKRQTRVKMELRDAQRANGEVQLKVYRLDDVAQNRSPLKTVRVPVTMPATVEIEWDGTDEMGNVLGRGVYAYDLLAWDTVSGSGGDMDIKSSNYLFIDVGTDDEGNPITEAEYAGYDDNGTPERVS
ncbi:MAG: hypothetical protein NZT92_19465, partial [Abditibacteriales bacterium]|nr:hypothetical protein [Abditibacteriales bacterium]MDW8365582.1 hypothetical protein [Abditibacteriales bacterium]